jgi:hypothetical protein
MIGAFVGFSRVFLLGILIFKGLTARRLYKSFGVKGLTLLLAGEILMCYSHVCIFKSALQFQAQKVTLSEMKAAFLIG